MCDYVVDKNGLEGSSWEDIIDTHGNTYSIESDDEEAEDDQNFISLDKLPESCLTTKKKKKSKNAFDLENTYLVTNYHKEDVENNYKAELNKLMEKSSLKPGFEKLMTVPVQKKKRALKRERKAERDKTKGKEWYNLPAPEITDELKNDLEILKMRSVLDSKHFYKKNDITATPKYFQVGRVIEGPADYYSGRIVKSQRKKTLVDELLSDSNFRAYQKKKYKEIVDSSRRRNRKAKSHKLKNDKKKKNRDDWLSWN